MKSFLQNSQFKIDDIISYTELTSAEGMNLQKGMNFLVKPDYSVFLMSIRKGAPYADKIDEKTNTLVYEGHDVPANVSDTPKEVDQEFTTQKGSLTENGKFYTAAQSFRLNLIKYPHRIKVYEKIQNGVWCYKGFYNLVDAKIETDGKRNVFKFYLQPVEIKPMKREVIIPFNRVIPTQVKVEVWARDKGQCVKCGSTENLHYDHDLPFSKGGTSLIAENVRILCMKCNLTKSNKILTIPPFLLY
ncbi:MAG: HNH endonuclease [Melioribacteraceae bacterium]|nr:MAG: HNH endonuclease [Melioribacteraceae bacterium]